MYEAIKNFARQFAYEPVIENAGALAPARTFLVVGMGGSHLSADLLKAFDPSCDLIVSHDYALPPLSAHTANDRLVVLSSYSGNTEEVLAAYDEAGARRLPRAVVSIGGELIARARKDGIPYVRMPDTGIQPRSALGFTLMALLTLMNRQSAFAEARKLASTLRPAAFEEEGRALSERMRGFVPVIYSSLKNRSLAYNWKIKLNETGKIPSFYNVFSELNHNEMTGFDAKGETAALAKNFYFLLLEDGSDAREIRKRMRVLAELYRDRALMVEPVPLQKSDNLFYTMFSSLILADWTAYHTAGMYGVEPEQVPMVEEFKKRIA